MGAKCFIHIEQAVCCPECWMSYKYIWSYAASV